MGFYLNTMNTSIKNLYRIFLDHPLICTDTRNIQNDTIFFSLKGETFNGNEFAETAINNGAAFAVVDEEKYVKDDRFLLVDNTLKTLQRLGSYHRSTFDIPVIGITGTNGKTTTKELIRNILSQKYKAQATIGNLNNHIGVPLTLLSVKHDTDIIVIEMGANHIGEIESLCKIANPNFGIITNIGKAHLEGFGSKEGIVKAKSELYSHMKNIGGAVFVNINNSLLYELSQNLNTVFYGDNPKAYTYGEFIEADPFVKLSWTNKDYTPDTEIQNFIINSKLIGAYNFENILAAICVGTYFDVEPEKIIRAIEQYTPVNNRSQIIEKTEKLIILDAYNANPSNMEAAILNLKKMPGEKKIAIIGDMLELGKYEVQEHRKILKLLKKQNFHQLIFVGQTFCKVCSSDDGLCFEDTDAAFSWLQNKPLPASVILLKASRGIKLEKLVDIL